MIKVLYENTDRFSLMSVMWRPDAIYLNSKAGTNFEYGEIKIPYISTKEFIALGSDVVVIIGCRTRANIDKAIKLCEKYGYKYMLIDDVIFKNYSIDIDDVIKKYKGKYVDNFGNCIIVSPKAAPSGTIYFSTTKTSDNCVIENKIYIGDKYGGQALNIHIGSSYNVIDLNDYLKMAI